MTDKQQLKEARLQLHQAAQLLAALGISYLDRKADDSHTNMAWNTSIQALQGYTFGPQKKLSLALNFPDLEYRFYDNEHVEIFSLDGKKDADALIWLKQLLDRKGLNVTAFTNKKHYEIPETDQSRGEAYNLFVPGAFKSMADQFDMAQNVLTSITQKNEDTSSIRCWPHHFDLAMLITLEKNDDPQLMKSVGIGLSPGDDSYDQPYYYVSPWPYPDKSLLNNNALPANGFWHTTGFISAILLAPSLDKSTAEEKDIVNFLETAIQICKRIILND